MKRTFSEVAQEIEDNKSSMSHENYVKAVKAISDLMQMYIGGDVDVED